MGVDCVSWLGSIFKHYITLHNDKYHPLNNHLMTTCRTLYRVEAGGGEMCFSPLPFTIKSINTFLRTLNKVGFSLNQYHVGMDYMIIAGIGFLVRLNLPLIHPNDTFKNT